MPTISGTSADETLIGTSGNDIIDGAGGNDTLTGGGGIDQLTGGAGSDIFSDTLAGLNGDTITDYNIGDSIVFTDANSYPFVFSMVGDTLNYYSGSFGGSLTLTGFNWSGQGSAQPLPGGGIQLTLQPIVPINGTPGDDGLAGTLGPDIIYAGDGNDTVFVSSGNDVVYGGPGNDYIDGGGNDDQIFGEDGDDIIHGGIGTDIVDGGAGNDTFVVRNDQFTGSDLTAGDQIIGGSGTDTIIFNGDFTYGFTAFDITAANISGVEVIEADLPVRLTVAQLSGLSSFSGLFQIVGTATLDLRDGRFGSGSLNFGSGNDVLTLAGTSAFDFRGIDGGAGDDQLTGGESADVITGGDGNDIIDGSGSADYLDGGNGNDTIRGGDGADTIVDGFGVDYMDGGLGDDLFKLDVSQGFGTGETVIGGAGIDTIWFYNYYGNSTAIDFSSLNISGVERMDASPIALIMSPNQIAQFDYLRVGAVTLNAAGSVSVGAVFQSNQFQLSAFGNAVDLTAALSSIRVTGGSGNDIVIGSSFNDNITGGDGNDVIHGGDSYDNLDGGNGIDWIDGGNGDDVLIVATGETISAGDRFTGGSGIDTLRLDNSSGPTAISDISIATVDADIEVLSGNYVRLTVAQANAFNSISANSLYLADGGTLSLSNTNFAGYYVYLSDAGNQVTGPNSGYYGIHVFGGAGNDVITAGSAAVNNELNGGGGNDVLNGGSGGDSLDGGTGADIMSGGLGNDTYSVDNVSDVVLEGVGQGHDLVMASVSFALTSGSEVEDIWLTGANNINATGNAINNVLTGNSGNNVLDGGAGADHLIGGAGDDTYVVDNAADWVDENGASGTDTVISSISFNLSADLENLTLTGSQALNGTGNDADNVLQGNSGDNLLSGLDGNDTLFGGAGADTLNGGTGADTFIGTKAELSGDTIADFGRGDRIVFSDATLANFTLSLTGHTLTYSGGSLSFDTLPPGSTLVASPAPEGGVQLMLAPRTGALFQATAPFDVNSVNLNWDYVHATQAALSKNVNYSFDGRTYPDAYSLLASDNVHSEELDFLGSGFSQDLTGRITAGTVNVMAVADMANFSLLWFVEGVSVSAPALYNAALTASNTDEIGLIQTALAGNDTLIMSGFDDRMSGYAGDDLVFGGAGQDTIFGGTGNDYLDGGSGDDRLDGEAGIDTAAYDDAATGVIVTLSSASAQNTVGAGIDTLLNIENLQGSAFADVLTGDVNSNQIFGGGGDDVLDGGAGADLLDGGSGNDQIVYDPSDNAVQVIGGAGYDVLVVRNLAVPQSFNLIAQGFEAAEVTQTDTGNNSWSTIVSIYNASWQLTSQDMHNDDGTRTYITADPTGAQTWSQQWFNYDAQARLTSEDIVNRDGSHVFIRVDGANGQTWSQDWFSYDAQGRLSSEDLVNDDNSHTFIRVDAAGTQNWAQDWFTYDSQGRLSSEDVRYDDGSHTFINIDENNSQPWIQDWFAYDAQGRLSSEDVRYDDGTHTFINIDENNSQPWSQDWFSYDAQGRLVSEDRINDDGSHTFITLDANGSQSWSQEWFSYDPQGHLTSTAVVWDDGHVTYM